MRASRVTIKLSVDRRGRAPTRTAMLKFIRTVRRPGCCLQLMAEKSAYTFVVPFDHDALIYQRYDRL
ncbi:hypothetical protein [Pedosphaera parvula]|uniref:Uncharacterized protein n=1 Tax=Pedosphaera parvula (strain Ellin514) TaxID=320771 RepID=B9XF22_PEDPL|nr:hypothetical protein [Pedosphaera parvula]EEF61520.1 hypothetical protein Cflav_PD4198 [Pedosphaera parvula Ellin514]